MSKKKITLAAIVLALILLIGGMIAYFTDEKTVTNVFTLGSVEISLTEPGWDASNGLNITPGKTVAKDPTITNTGAMPAYVFAEVKVPMTTENPSREAFTYSVNSGWVELSSPTSPVTANGYTTHIYAYGTSSAMTPLAPSAATPAVFNSVALQSVTSSSVIPVDNNRQFQVEVKGKAIQANDLGVSAPADVYALFGNS